MQKRQRITQTEPLGVRLARRSAALRQKADALPPGAEREFLLNKLQQLDFAIDLEDVLRSPSQRGNDL
jgi:hypothetical protein